MTEHIPFGTQPDPRSSFHEELISKLRLRRGTRQFLVTEETALQAADALEQLTKPVVWSPPPIKDRPEGFECLVWHRGRWRHVRWVRNHNMWMFGYGSPGIANELGRQFAPLPDLNPGIYGDFWQGERS